ncbi:MAG: decaprenyl-phosphate phosphoribosyltransferase [Clostridiales bacterium]|nr:decaprenyl-phosphate phosphoribosyltransferase [Clostridiales bacterium]
MKYFLKEMRVHHYLKNLLVFVPLACSGQIFDRKKLTVSVFAFLSFCFISSAIYFINDIRDKEKDRNHPTKKNRPIAAGKISVKAAVIFTVFLIVLAAGFNVLCFNLYSSLLLALYFAINIGYSFGLKNIPLLDIAILVAGFLIRALYGSVVTGILISNWLYLVIISVAFYLGLGKRRNELKKQGDEDTRKVIKKYPFAFLDNNMYMCMGLIFVFYALWTVDEKTIAVYQSANLIWTVPVVMLIFMKYSLTVEGNSDGDPVEVLLRDKLLVGLCVLYLLLMFALLYVLR